VVSDDGKPVKGLQRSSGPEAGSGSCPEVGLSEALLANRAWITGNNAGWLSGFADSPAQTPRYDRTITVARENYFPAANTRE
jgi:hypothetical protein